MIIHVRDLPEDDALLLDGEVDPGHYSLPEEIEWSPIQYHLRASKLGRECLVQGSLKTTASRDCDRCLEKMAVPVECDFVHSFELRQLKAIDLTHPVHEDILLNLPIAFRCQLDAENRCPITGRVMEDGPDRFQEVRRKETWQVLENLDKKE
jgi:uncharacterized protein